MVIEAKMRGGEYMLDLVKFLIELALPVSIVTAWYLTAKQKIDAQYDADVAKAEQEYKKSTPTMAVNGVQGK